MIKDATINIRTNTKIKEKAQKVLEANGISLSTFINNQLLRAANAKTLRLDFETEEPSEMLIEDRMLDSSLQSPKIKGQLAKLGNMV
ncbi:MAG: hypothetical protein CO042_01905 [Parcubacteria group bacterium CG_4_9_14_0_2_um_filter_41_8]|nr:MAG: hypothetical protein AUJ34_02205 [Parcubacteria group bacterium CG1_02_41_12]PIP67358.1 MAG: hypothetical protein COW93_00535 [Parcubacteria group bacterium CG22_combo_CG10-13_8_21_14_all_41_9]PIQ78131.1 MAG: hypothetical protein COV79_05525 [Parcubacteria group bacterium CG11_big_fil_rev_8_21_14_0_20_41_14]PIZ81319.1 MAG: hypothetical protein COY02_02715 [Parcubacteria group bacterium CG_4_10_14_0_2_um_filter_41_6]PJC40788.1 MAG: hypothetical protein CO042_01905 [Parcubacteria group ba